MRDPNRIDVILNRVRLVWKRYPDLRLAQIIVNAAKMTEYQDGSQSRIFYIEDDDLVRGIEMLEKLGKL
jgi:uncharacterized protein YihD (DUF1040 family)